MCSACCRRRADSKEVVELFLNVENKPRSKADMEKLLMDHLDEEFQLVMEGDTMNK